MTGDCSAGLRIDRVARHERGHRHAGGDRQGEVPGWDDHGHAARDVLGKIGLTRGHHGCLGSARRIISRA